MKISEFYNRYIEFDFELDLVLRELKEVFTATSFENLKEELNDVSFTLQCYLHFKTKLDWEMFWSKPSIAKMQDRLNWFQHHFRSLGLEFHPRFWSKGSNYKKQDKVNLAVQKAIEEIANMRP